MQTEGPAATPATFAPAERNTTPFSVLIGANWASAYYFRGFQREQSGNNVQPYLELGLRLLKDVGPLSSLVIAPGIWTNWHVGGCDGQAVLVGQCNPDPNWTSTDPYLKITATWWEVLSTTVTYTYFTTPQGGFESGNGEVGLSFSLNDSKWLGAFALNPNLFFAFDYATERFDADRIYMGLGFAPGYTFFENSRFPVNISLPMTFGFSVKDFYTVRTERLAPCPVIITPGFGQCTFPSFENQTFGYFSGGPLISMPLKFIPASFGNWILQGGVQFLVLNSALVEANTRPFVPTTGNSSFMPIGSVGLSLTY